MPSRNHVDDFEQDAQERPASPPVAAEQVPALSSTAGVVARLGDTSATTAERQALAARLGPLVGNRQMSGLMREALLQRNGTTTAAPPGRGLCTEFGDYWIVPDNTTVCYVGVEGEQITETQFAELRRTWDALKSGSGQVKVQETDNAGVVHAGFKNMVMGLFGTLLSAPAGRGLVTRLVNGSQAVTVMPTPRRMIGSANRGARSVENADGTAGAGGTSTIMIDDDLRDDSLTVSDEHGAQIAAPVWTVLGHELIHAEHNAAGRNRRNQASTDAAYPNREEQETIQTGSLSENTLRGEHGLPNRHGHGVTDTRPSP
jgi:hypothetical protein